MLHPIKYRITCRRTVTDPKERARRVAQLFAIFAKQPKPEVEKEARPEGAMRKTATKKQNRRVRAGDLRGQDRAKRAIEITSQSSLFPLTCQSLIQQAIQRYSLAVMHGNFERAELHRQIYLSLFPLAFADAVEKTVRGDSL